MDDVGLGGEQPALETGEDQLMMGAWLAGIDRWIGTVESIQQFVAELGDEILQGEGERRGGGFEQIALFGRIGQWIE